MLFKSKTFKQKVTISKNMLKYVTLGLYHSVKHYRKEKIIPFVGIVKVVFSNTGSVAPITFTAINLTL